MKYSFFLAFVFLAGCTPSIKPEQLYGHWKYISVININLPRPDTLDAGELELQNPSIHFASKNELYIIWGGEKFSEGTFEMDGSTIRYTEKLPEGGKRTFPFIVTKFENKEMVFETTGNSAIRVTAKKIE